MLGSMISVSSPKESNLLWTCPSDIGEYPCQVLHSVLYSWFVHQDLREVLKTVGPAELACVVLKL